MSKTFERILRLVHAGEVRIPEHGYDELAADGLAVRDIMAATRDVVIVEDYPGYPQEAVRARSG